MDTNFVILKPTKEDNTDLAVHDQEIRLAAERYTQTKQRANELKADAEDRLFAGSPGTVYLKKLGHRPLSTDDISQIINALGTDEQKQSIDEFTRAQELLSKRLKPIGQYIRLVLEQADMTYPNYHKRLKQPDLWKPEQMIRIVEVVDRLRV